MDKVKKFISDPKSMIIFGLVCYIAGFQISYVPFGVSLKELLVSLGSFFVVMVPLQYYFDITAKASLIKEIIDRNLRTTRISKAGIIDAYYDHHEVKYEEIILTSETLIICSQYSDAWYQRHFENLIERINAGKPTTFLMLNPNSHAIKYLGKSKTPKDIDSEQIELFSEIKRRTGSNFKTVNIRRFDSVLRYSFVGCDKGIWVRFYKNAKGISKIPLILCESKTPLFDFFDRDVRDLVDSSEEVQVG
jgi:hypothetical protein